MTSTIGEHVVRVGTWNPAASKKAGEFDYIDLSSVDQNLKQVNRGNRRSYQDAPSRARQLVKSGDVLVSTVRPNLNSVAVVPPHLDGATASTGFTVLRPKPSLDGRYLFHWVKSPEFIRDMSRKATGASYPAVSDRVVKESYFPLPPLPEQRRIAAILDQADLLRAKRRQTLALLDDLARTVFIEMFGGPEVAAERWGVATVGSVCSRLSVGVVVRPASYYVPSGVPALRSTNIHPGRIVLQDIVYFSAADNDNILAKSKLRSGDVVLVRTGRPGTAAVVPPDLDGANAIDLILATPDPASIHPAYLAGLMNSVHGQRLVHSEKVGQIQQHFNVGALARAAIPLPPMEVQRVYVRRLEAIGALRASLQMQVQVVESLVSALQSDFFPASDTASRHGGT